MNVMNAEAYTHMVKARAQLLLKHFFFGRLALMLQLRENTDIPTFATDGKYLHYNPDLVMKIVRGPQPLQLRSEVVHEVLHCVLDHFSRRGWREPHGFNVAADLAINPLIKEANFVLGKDWLLDMQYAGKSAEEIYDLLPKDQRDSMQPQDQILDGASQPGEQSMSPEERRQTSQQWKINVTAVANEAKKQGKLPASLDRFVGELLTPKVAWQDVLRRFVSQLTADDYSWRRANRRFVAQGLFMPTLYSESLGPIGVVIDSSGSINQQLLTEFMSEINGIAAAARPEKIIVVDCDAAVHSVTEFQRGEPIEVQIKGGGGTDFRPAIDHFREDPPAAVIYLTDMYGTFGEEPDFPVLWCATTDVTAPWGETVRM